MGDGTADGVRVDSLAEWQAAAEEVRRLERVAQGKRETLLSAARADALAQGELGAGRRLLAGLERALIEGTALAGPSPVRAGLNATRREINGAARKVPVEDWGGADFALPPAGGWRDSVRLSDEAISDSVTTEQAQAHLAEAMRDAVKVGPGETKPVGGANVTNTSPFDLSVTTPNGATATLSLTKGDAPSTDYYAGGDKRKRQDAKPETSPADYWSGKARNPRRWWQVWRKK